MITRSDVGEGIEKLIALMNEFGQKHPAFIQEAMAGRDIGQALAYIGQQADKKVPTAEEFTREAMERGIMGIGDWDGKS